jgi:hypothetical protein
MDDRATNRVGESSAVAKRADLSCDSLFYSSRERNAIRSLPFQTAIVYSLSAKAIQCWGKLAPQVVPELVSEASTVAILAKSCCSLCWRPSKSHWSSLIMLSV